MLCRWTGFFIANPRVLASLDPFWADVDVEAWSERFEWERDDFDGLLDVSQNPFETYSRERGDCVDYATVVASWAVAHNRSGLGVAICGHNSKAVPIPRHVIAYDDERTYSSGVIREGTPSEYLDASEYDWIVTRSV